MPRGTVRTGSRISPLGVSAPSGDMKMKKTSSDASPSASSDGKPAHSSGSQRMANRPTPIRTTNGASFTSVVRTESDVPYRTPRMFTAASAAEEQGEGDDCVELRPGAPARRTPARP